jgi:threonine/homoserine/homoserine lactone efflux protein
LSAPGASAPKGHSLAGSFVLGLTTQASNPKTAIVYASVMAAFLPAQVTAVFALSLLALIFAVEAGWYSLVALALSSKRPREAYFRAKLWVDRLAGGALMALSLSLLASAHPA